MTEYSPTPHIAVTIGHHTRLYCSFATTAPTELDAPSTITLHVASLGDIAFLASEPLAIESARAHTSARVVLVDTTELTWQRARYRSMRYALMPLDQGLVEHNTLQRWLWRRLQSSTDHVTA